MRATSIDALLLIDKPAGVTSHDVVAVARRALGTRKVGHGGTLDPFATGLLVLLTGRGTRLLPHVPGEPKVYETTICFGSETETDDATGAVVRAAPLPTADDVQGALPGLTGTIAQLPPAYSAKHVGGRRAYDVARRGGAPRLDPVAVRVDAWEVVDWSGASLTARVTCGGGTYIRALARDLGRAVGSAAHCASLRRLQSGPFHVDSASSLDALRAGTADTLELPAAIPNYPTVTLDAGDTAHVRHGRSIALEVAGDRAALVDASGELIALARREGASSRWHPDVVLAAP